jgi:hypothetical protein
MIIHIRSDAFCTFELECNENDTMDMLKDRISDKKNISNKFIKFVVKGKRIDNNFTVIENDIKNQELIYMLYTIN